MTTPLRVRPAAVAGTFYPGRPGALERTIDADLAQARPTVPTPRPKILIVPHAGYVYSGPVAASAYARLRPWRGQIRHVVLLGPAHRVAVRSMALSSADLWETPLGSVAIDDELRTRVASLPGVEVDDAAHGPEHSLEVQVPFLQRVLGSGWSLLPVVVGTARPEEVAALLDAVWGDDDTLIVISTDLSHYHPDDEARVRDRATADAIMAGALDRIGPHDACGAYPVRGALLAAARHRLDVDLLDLRTSADTAGDPDRVVGYGAFVATTHAPSGSTTAEEDRGDEAVDAAGLTASDRDDLLGVAEEAVRAALEGRPARVRSNAERSSALRRPGAAFVTLRDGDRLIGCIGSIEPSRPLVDDVADNALGAAFRDPRLPALTPDEFARASIHLSVLGPLEPLAVGSLGELASAIEPGRDGVLIEAGRHRATFLPSVWEQLPRPNEFLEHLWRKAGLRPGAWPSGMRAWRYRVVEFGHDGPRRPVATR